MRKLIMFNMLTLDGYFEGTNREIDWHVVDKEFNEFAIEQLNSADVLLFGRITYQLMAAYWPTEQTIKNDPVVAGIMNSISKIVFSKTLTSIEWNNSRLIKENAAEEIIKLKKEKGKDIIILGSGNLTSFLTQLRLIDEFRIMLNPVILGNGNPLFKTIKGKIELKLIKTRAFNSGNVLLYYEPIRKNA